MFKAFKKISDQGISMDQSSCSGGCKGCASETKKGGKNPAPLECAILKVITVFLYTDSGLCMECVVL